MEKEFEGKTALVTGGSRGIGRAVCLDLAQSGAKVAVNFTLNASAAEKTVEMIRNQGGEAFAVRADVSRPVEVQSMVSQVEETHGPVNLLVTSAGIVRRESHETLTYEIWKEIMEVNMDGTFLPVMALKDGMLERGFGRIVCIASIAGLRPRPNNIAYSASKAGVIGFVRSCSEALAPKIRINCLAPGLIETEMISTLDPERRRAMIQATRIPRTGTPEEMSNVVHFLLSEKASFVTGQTYVADGGRVTLP
ncbi:MAG TPA: 3-oxoacyl-ACP reductase family protein [SAR324 cluster bacterium]|nr:3-oxoacyl-ACP reductase family protein [SAR324 cluster bacterium]